MKTFAILLWAVFQLGSSLRFNEQLDSINEQVDAEEGRRRRRRRRRRSSGGGPPSGLSQPTVFLHDMSVQPTTNTANTATTVSSVDATLTIKYTGWMVCFSTKDGHDAVFHGEAIFNFNEQISYWFETRLATTVVAKADWFVGFAKSNYAAVGADPTDGVGFSNDATTRISFQSKKGSAGVDVAVKTKLVGGVDLVMLASALGTQDSKIPSGPKTNIYKLGWAFIPLGQYGVSFTPTTAGAKGWYRIFLEGAHVVTTEATHNCDNVQLSLTVGSEGEHEDPVEFMVDYVAYSLPISKR